MNTTVLLDRRPAEDGLRIRMLLRIEGSPPPAGTRTPLDLALVLDRSGSMGGGKMEAARRAAIEVVRRLWPADRVSVVAYDDEVLTLAARVEGGDEPGLTHRIGALFPRNSTNLSGGWLRGRELLVADGDGRRIRRIVLLTDGLANVGVTDPDRLASLCARSRNEGVSTTTIGFGTDYDERLLRSMAEAGGGGTYYIEHPDQAVAIFQDELSDLLGTCAQNVAVTLRPADGVRSVRVRHAYPGSATPEGVRYDMGDLYAREPRLLLAEFTLARTASEAVTVATITITADVIEDDDVRHVTITLPVTVDAHGVPATEPTIEREALLLDAADAREQALEDRARGDFDSANLRLSSTLGRLRAAGLSDEQVLAEIEDLDALSAAPPASMASEANAKYLYQRAYERKTGRSRKQALTDRKRRDDGV